MVERSSGDPMVACYIDSSFPALLHFAYKYADSPERAVLANANAGGENVARGSLLGALLGAAHGIDAFPEWSRTGLHGKDQIFPEIDTFVASTSAPKSEL
jgi:ADP-ribosyl-[dinitrogen reductase] hydrolase